MVSAGRPCSSTRARAAARSCSWLNFRGAGTVLLDVRTTYVFDWRCSRTGYVNVVPGGPIGPPRACSACPQPSPSRPEGDLMTVTDLVPPGISLPQGCLVRAEERRM